MPQTNKSSRTTRSGLLDSSEARLGTWTARHEVTATIACSRSETEVTNFRNSLRQMTPTDATLPAVWVGIRSSSSDPQGRDETSSSELNNDNCCTLSNSVEI